MAFDPKRVRQAIKAARKVNSSHERGTLIVHFTKEHLYIEVEGFVHGEVEELIKDGWLITGSSCQNNHPFRLFISTQ